MFSGISKEIVRGIIIKEEKVLNECFDLLLDCKYLRGNIEAVLLEFQPKLAECLFRLMQLYRRIKDEERILISQKSEYSPHAFSTIMAERSTLLKTISFTIEVGKRLGDAFVWPFFRNNREEYEQHIEHPSTGLFVGGIGGLGELEFIKKTQQLRGMYVLYHSITTTLRIGDFSLYDSEHGIVGIGELKTKQNNDDITVTASITIKENTFQFDSDFLLSSQEFDKKISDLQKDFPKLKRQLNEHYKLLNEMNRHFSTTNTIFSSYTKIDNLSTQEAIMLNDEKSLLAFICERREDNLFDIFYSGEVGYEFPKGWEEQSLQLYDPTSQFNVFKLGQITIFNTGYETPIIWLPFSDNTCKNLYFQRISIATVFNTAKFLQRFIDDGFNVSRPSTQEQFEISVLVNGNRVVIENIDAIFRLITHCLIEPGSVYDYVLNALNVFESEPRKKGDRVKFHIRL